MNKSKGTGIKLMKTTKVKWKYIAVALLFIIYLTGCGENSKKKDTVETAEASEIKVSKETANDSANSAEKVGLQYETADDGHIDFISIQKENPDIFAWLYIPGTNIDFPVLQSAQADDYYKTHLADGKQGEGGALYTEMANLMNMCDFNTIIHGKDSEEDLFADLHEFENPDFFKEHTNLYIYLPDNVLTYTIFAAYYDEGSDILRRFDYTTYEGCQSYLEQIYGLRNMEKNQRAGWADLTPYHFLVTLNGSIREKDGKQYVLLGVLVGDAAGKIDRVILD